MKPELVRALCDTGNGLAAISNLIALLLLLPMVLRAARQYFGGAKISKELLPPAFVTVSLFA